MLTDYLSGHVAASEPARTAVGVGGTF